MSLKSLTRQNYVNKSIQNSIAPTGTGVAAPVITSIIICDSNYNNLDDTSLSPSGSYVKLIGTGFKTGCTVYFNNESLTATFVSGTEVRIQTPATTVGAYNIMLFNPNNAGGAIYLNLSVSNFPTYTTSAGSLGSYYEANTISNTIVATGDTPLSYSLYSGSLPDGATLNSDGTITGTSPAESGSTTYSFVVNVKDAQGQDATRSFSLTINTDPVTWSSPNDNQVISAYEYAPISNVTLSATTAAGKAITYSANALPGGITLNDSTISGTNNVVGNTYTRLTATAATTGRTATRDVVFNVNPDVVTWSSPADAAEYTLEGGSAMANVTLSATSAAGRTISYTANALPSGLNLSDNTIYGTPDTTQTVYTLLTATAETTNRSATRTISWTISLGDTYWKYNTLLLSADNTIKTPSFVSDNSINNAQLTVAGDARPSNFNPYQVGYYSNFFDGIGDYLTTAASTNFDMGTGDFTIECFALTNGYAGSQYGRGLFALYPSGSYNKRIIVRHTNADNRLNIYGYDGTNIYFGISGTSGSYALVPGTWNHIAFVRQSGVFRLYINGVQDIVVSNQTAVTLATSNCFDIGRVQEGTVPEWNGNISNFRVIKGTCLYNNGTTFTPPTTPFLPSPTIQLLTCQSNRLIDSSPTNITLTKGGDTKVSSAHPFSTVYQAGTQYYSTYFDGTGDYLSTVCDLGTSQFTAECWGYMPNTATGAQQVLFSQYITAPNGRWAITVSASGYPEFVVNGLTEGNLNIVAGSTIQSGVWHHFAVTRNASNVFTFWVNGVSVGTGTRTGSLPSSSVGFTIGGLGNAGGTLNLLTGYVSNLRIVKNTVLYTSNFTPSTTPLTAVSGTQLLTCQDSTFKDNSTNNFTITGSGDAKPIAVGPFTPSSYTSTEITTYGSGYFDGSGHYITIPATPSTVLTGDFTVEAWIYPTVLNTNNMVFGSDNGTNSDYFNITSSSINFAISAPTSPNYPSWNYTFTENQWYHVVLVRQSNTLSAFVNGIKLTLSSGSASESRQFFQSSVALFIGRYGYASNPWNFTGYISGARIVKGTALYTSNFVPQFTSPLSNVTNTQLLTLQSNGAHNNSTFKDSSSFNNLITRTGNVTNGTFSPYGDNWSTYFNGSLANQYFTLPTATATLLGGFNGNYTTIEFFVNQTQTSTAATENEIFGTFAAAAANGRFIVTIGSASATNQPSKVRLMWTTSTGTTDQVIATNTIPVNTWAHVAIVVNATGSAGSHTVTIYTNGSGETFTSKDFSSQTLTYDRLRVGGNSESYLYGYLSNLRVTRATTNTVGYSGASISVPTGPLSALPSTKLLLCQSNRFIDSSINTNTVSVLGTPTVQKFSPFSTVTVPKYYSTYFDGNGDWLTFTNTSGQGVNFGTGDFTVELWYYMTDNTTNSTYHTFIRQDTATNAFDFGYRPGAGNLTVASGNVGEVTASVTLAKNTWYHLAASRSGTSLRFFVNGTQVGTTATNSYNFNVTGGTVRIGGNSFNSAYTPYGYISNLRCTKEALYTTNFTPSIAPLITGANTTLLTCQSNLIVDNSVNGYTLTVNGDVKPLPVSPFTPTASSATSYNSTDFGGSLYMTNAAANYLRIIDYSYLWNTSATTTPFTVEAWIYPIGITGGCVVSGMYANSKVPFVIGIGNAVGVTATNNQVWFGYYSGGWNGVISPSQLTMNQWTHVAGVYDGTNRSLYLNGIKVVTAAATWPAFIDTTTAGYIGKRWDGTGGGSNGFNGYITDVRISKGVALYTSNFYPSATPLTPATTLGANTYSSNLLLTGTSDGVIDATRTVDLETVADAKVTNFSPYNGSYYSNYFDGNDTRLTVPAGTAFNMGSGDFSIEMWVNPVASSTYGALLTFDAADFPICIYYGSGVNGGNIMAAAGTGSAWFTNTSAMTFGTTVPGKWSHILLTRSGDSWRCFQDGVLRYYATQSGTVGDSSGNIYIGANGSSIYRVTSYISNLRIIKGSVPTGYQTSSTTVGATIFTPSTSPLTTTSQGATASQVSLLTCQSNKFIDNSLNGFTVTNVNSGIKTVTRNPFQINTGQSYYFDGTGDYLSVTNNLANFAFGSGDFTVELWVHQTSLVAAVLVDFRGATSNVAPSLELNSSGKLVIYKEGSGTLLTSTNGITAGSWNHLVYTRVSGVLKVFVNGVLDPTTANDTTNWAIPSGKFTIGGNKDAGGLLNGYISDLRITKGAARTITVPTTPLTLK